MSVNETAAAEEPTYEGYEPRFTVADGFRFGCGFILAAVAFVFLTLIGLAVVTLAASVMGVPLPFLAPR